MMTETIIVVVLLLVAIAGVAAEATAAATAAAAAAAAAAAHPQPKSCAWSSEGPQRRSANGRGGQQRSVWRMSRRYLIVVIVTNNANK